MPPFKIKLIQFRNGRAEIFQANYQPYTYNVPSDEDAVFWGFSIHKNLVSVSSDRLGGVPKGVQSDFHWILVMNKQNLPSEVDFGQYCGF